MADAPRTGFGPTVLAGLATAVLTSVAAGKPWFHAGVDDKLVAGVRDSDKAADMPVALAVALVVLAGWGAVLVTRGLVRRLVAGLALVAALGVVAAVVAAPFTLPDQVRDNLPAGTDDVSVSPTGWFMVAGAAALASAALLVVAVVRIPAWPTMSSRYDAPATQSPDTSDQDLWKALDAGRDPTDPGSGSGP
jgi:hypothetical protein